MALEATQLIAFTMSSYNRGWFQYQYQYQYNYISFYPVPSWELTCPLPFGTFESMMFLFLRWDMFVHWRVCFVYEKIVKLISILSSWTWLFLPA